MHRAHLASLVCLFAVAACAQPSQPAEKAAAAPTAKPALVLGAAITAPRESDVALAEIAGNPKAYVGKTLTTKGTIVAVCQHMGCWMEIRDDAGGTEAHVKMAGHDFSVPKNASGRKARVQGTLTSAPEDEAECNAEAAKQMGKPVAKLQLEATGVQLD